MVMFAIELDKPGLEVLANVGEDPVHRVQVLLVEHVAPGLGDENQMHVKRENAVPAVAKLAVCFSWPSHWASLEIGLRTDYSLPHGMPEDIETANQGQACESDACNGS